MKHTPQTISKKLDNLKIIINKQNKTINKLEHIIEEIDLRLEDLEHKEKYK